MNRRLLAEASNAAADAISSLLDAHRTSREQPDLGRRMIDGAKSDLSTAIQAIALAAHVDDDPFVVQPPPRES